MREYAACSYFRAYLVSSNMSLNKQLPLSASCLGMFYFKIELKTVFAFISC